MDKQLLAAVTNALEFARPNTTYYADLLRIQTQLLYPTCQDQNTEN